MKVLLGFIIMAWVEVAFSAPMTVDADRFEMFQNEQRAEFYGHVIVHRDDMVMKADTIKIWYQDVNGSNELKDVDAQGNVEITTKNKKGVANKATFSAGSQLLILTGDARVQDGSSNLEGEVIEYNTKTEDIKVRQGKAGKQVHFTFDDAGK